MIDTDLMGNWARGCYYAMINAYGKRIQAKCIIIP
jgi:hypothetical protein